MKLLTKAIAATLVKNYEHSAETGESAKDVVVKYFTPWANATWYVSEGMPVDNLGRPMPSAAKNPNVYDWHLYGYCDLGDPMMAELGYVMLSDLMSLKGPAGLKVERDLSSSLPSMAVVLEKYGRAA